MAAVTGLTGKLTKQAIRQQLNHMAPASSSGGVANFKADKSQFANILNQTINQDNQNATQDLMKEMLDSMSLNAKPMEVTPADNITIELSSGEIPQEQASSAGDILNDLLGEVNNNHHSMERMMEQMLNGSTKMSTRDLIAAQMMSAKFSLVTELTGKVAASAGQSVQTLNQMAV